MPIVPSPIASRTQTKLKSNTWGTMQFSVASQFTLEKKVICYQLELGKQLAKVSTECSSRHQGERVVIVEQLCLWWYVSHEPSEVRCHAFCVIGASPTLAWLHCACVFVCLLAACLWPYTVNFKWAWLNFKITKIELMHSVWVMAIAGTYRHQKFISWL